MAVLYVILLFLSEKNEKYSFCSSCRAGSYLTDGMVGHDGRSADGFMDSVHADCHWYHASVFMDDSGYFFPDGALLLHESFSYGRIYGLFGVAIGIFRP